MDGYRGEAPPKTPRILVINPNSNPEVTSGIFEGLAPLRSTGAVIQVATLEGTPLNIETDEDVHQVVRPLCDAVRRKEAEFDAFVIACFSDPGLHAVRAVTRCPVFGIAASGILHALSLGERVGIISILPSVLPRHARYFRALGVRERIARDISVGTHVDALAEDEAMPERMRRVGRVLTSQYGADVLVLGCAGMARFRPFLEDALGCPVVDPCQSAVANALAAVLLGYSTL